MSTIDRASRFVETVRQMREVFTSDADWPTKYELIFPLAREARESSGVTVDYWDPDTTYEEDATACYQAYEAKARELAKAIGVDFDEEG